MRALWWTASLLTSAVAAGQDGEAYSPPSYPSPWGEGKGDWADAYEKARDFVSKLTLAEKVNLTTGTGWMEGACVGETGSIPRLGFRGLCLQDGPLGVRFTGVNVAATWDRSLAHLRGQAMGKEFGAKGADIQLGPVAGPLGRTPEGGRNWEGFSPDPMLTGVLMAETIKGIQDAGVIACAKHYILNEQEHFRLVGEAKGYGYNISASASSNIDDKTLHELYLWPFADAVRAGVGSVMCSYNQVNNSYACANSYTLNNLLKGELDFQGFVMSDWGAHTSGVSSTLAGLDMSMPGDTAFDTGDSYWGTNLTISVVNGTVPSYRLDDMAIRIMAAFYKVGRDRHQVPVNFNSWTRDTYGPIHAVVGPEYGVGRVNERVDVRGNHAALIRGIGAASTVLLKNAAGVLPLTGLENFTAIFGSDARADPLGANGCGDHGCDNGTLASGWGSGTSSFPYLVTPEEAIKEEILSKGAGIVDSVTDDWAYDKIQALASQADVSLVFVNSDSGENFISVDGNEGDRNNLTLWKDGDELIRNVAAENNNTIVVIHSGGPVLVGDWYENPNVTAILWAGMPGQETGNSIADILYGRVNPGGKTPFTWGKSRTDYSTDVLYTPNNGIHAPQIDFTEGIFIDYRGFDKVNITPVYEFGFGLSYTTFEYSDLHVESVHADPYKPTTGFTSPAPATAGNYSKNWSDYLFPTGILRIPLFLYPWLNTTDPARASADPDYGMAADKYLPPNATSGAAQPLHPAGGAPGGNPGLYDEVAIVTANITNTGSVSGDEVPQLYVSLGGPDDPKVVLRGFDRISFYPQETKQFKVALTRRDVSNWDVVSQNWVVTNYTKTVYVGSSSRDLQLKAPLKLVL
ncbi:putative beta-glucosidase A [Talaromyces atroroseus]|uniref:beta-glucosidase n=1 Tax=Talaromyces atroroseus TaxID=1441469 RepID=A0A225AHZ3_TALAT|nr:putative beta-glucosidase A [Talaromyces atroroseus]OKL57834.1 putative beta-glucosidase A [Talaromyces atroroseus]